MTQLSTNIQPERIEFLKKVLPASFSSFIELLEKSGTTSAPTNPPPDFQKVLLANDLARLSQNDTILVKLLLDQGNVKNLRDIALNFDDKSLAALINSDHVSAETAAVVKAVAGMDTTKDSGQETAVSNVSHLVVSEPVDKTTVSPKTMLLVQDFQRKLFHEEPSAMISRLVRTGVLDVSMLSTQNHTSTGSSKLATNGKSVANQDDSHVQAVKDGVVKFFEANQPNFNIRNVSVLRTLADPKSLSGIQDEHKSDVVSVVKRLQTTQALTQDPNVVPALFHANLTSASTIASIPQSNFVSNFSAALGGTEITQQIHTHATNVNIRNNEAMTTMLQTLRGTGLAAIDGSETRVERLKKLQNSPILPPQANLEELFGSIDYCACDDCTSITSPAAYLVELFEFLRNNNLNPTSSHLGVSWVGSPLEKLLRRRPDLANLQLTCANTNTVLPYIDLANEVMESFVVHLDSYKTDTNNPKQSVIEVFNIDPNGEGAGGSSPELLAEPQNTNYEAYCILKNAVYPAANLPYNQPIEEIRLLLGFLGTSKAELGEVFQESYLPPTSTIPDTSSLTPTISEEIPSSGVSDSSSDAEATTTTFQQISPELQAELISIHKIVLQRADDAELLLLTQEEYIIITKQAFWLKRYFDIRHGMDFTIADYQTKIGVKNVYSYWGADYTSVSQMISNDENAKKGLPFVKLQFLPRSGISYEDLVNLLQTQFINPNLPTGKSLATMASLKFSYMFLKSLIDPTAKSTKDKFKSMIAFLDDPSAGLPIQNNINALIGADHTSTTSNDFLSGGCGQPGHVWNCECKIRSKLHRWIYKNFEKIGCLIVLESGEGPELPWEADLIIPAAPAQNGPPETTVPKLRMSVQSTAPISDPFPNGLPIPTTSDQTIAHLDRDGRILASNGYVMARVFITGQILLPDWSLWSTKYGSQTVALRRTDQSTAQANFDAFIYQGSSVISDFTERRVTFSAVQDDCNLDNVRLRHLDGTTVTEKEYDQMHRFLRLWKKLGWSMQELDGGFRGLGAIDEIGTIKTPGSSSGSGSGVNTGSPDADWYSFQDSCTSGTCGGVHCKKCSPDESAGGASTPNQSKGHSKRSTLKPISDITPGFLHQVQALKKLVNLTGLTVLQILTFFTNIDVFGPNSLYSQLFLTHNVIGTDQIFKADSNGNYLTASPTPKISDHVPVLLAAFRLKPDDLNAIQSIGKITDELTLENVSAIYRHTLLSSILGIKPTDLATISTTFDSPWVSAQAALDLVKLWNRMSSSGFTFQQIAYVTKNIDDPIHPIGPSQTTILKTTKALYDGLNNIDAQNTDILDVASATSDAVTARAQLLFGSALTGQILGFLEGTSDFSTNAPKGLSIIIPSELVSRIKYADGDNAQLQVTGQLTADAMIKAQALSSNPKWSEAFARVAKQALSFFNANLKDIFLKPDDAKAALVSGDVIPAAGSTNTGTATAPGKRFYFLQALMPFLRHTLAERLVVDTMGSTVSLPADITNLLLSTILVTNTIPQQTSLAALEQIHNVPAEPQNGWKGFLVVSTTDSYKFSCLSVKDDDQPLNVMLLDNQPIIFSTQQADPSNVWFSAPIPLIGGRIYPVTLTGRLTTDLKWMTVRSTPTSIPPSALIPSYSIIGTSQVFVQLFKSAIVVNGFNMAVDEIKYLQANSADFDSFDLNSMKLSAWKRCEAYTSLRNSISPQSTTLIDLFKWTSNPTPDTTLFAKIRDATLWDVTKLEKLCASEHFNFTSATQFRNEINLLKLQTALKVADRIGMDINELFMWAEPSIKFWPSHAIAKDIRKAARATLSLTDWETAIKPILNGLRKGQSQALVSYLTVQPELVSEGVIDGDSLFEFFLIDVQMGACLETSRLKQATSSVQQFIQRCMLGLEDKLDGSGVALNALDRERWLWMQKYRVWEAARKVFLYPENWIVSSLRDDKSPIYGQMESTLLQKDVTSQTVTDAIQSYLFSLDAVANLEIIGIYLQNETLILDDGLGTTIKQLNRLHLFGRSRQAPFFFYNRYYDILAQNWMPWQSMQVDIPSYETSTNGNITGNGTYVIPFTFNGRLLVAVPQITKKTLPAVTNGTTTWDTFGKGPMAASVPLDYWEIKLGYSELRNGKWTQKILTTDACYEDPPPTPLPSIDTFQFIPRVTKGNDGAATSITIDFVRAGNTLIGSYMFDGKLMSKGGKPTTAPSPSPQSDIFEYAIGSVGPDSAHLTQVRTITSLQAEGSSGNLTLINNSPSVTYPLDVQSSSDISYAPYIGATPVTEPFNHQFVHELMSKVIAADSVDGIYAYFQTITDVDQKNNAYGQDTAATYSELKRPYSLYNWEIGFHMPMALADNYLQTQQFDLALKMCNFVFDPFYKGTDDKRFWRWPPFREVDSVNTMEKLFGSLHPNQPAASSGQINQWRDNPFSPHVIARLRPVAYMKWAVMKYLQILIAYGDYYFTQNTLEMVPMAIQCYVLASHVYGQRGQKIPKRGRTLGQTYQSLSNSWDPFGNAMVQMELMFPFSNQIDQPIGLSNGVVGLANIFGFATTRYFCIPDNPQLVALRDTIDDRLFKIRHCQDIFGTVQHLPLYEPPIDPGLLVAAAAQGLSIASVLNDLDATMPNYRFPYILSKAIELCGELKALGGALLSAREKQDAEALSLLRQKHEGIVLAMGMDDKKMALDEAQKTLGGLQQNRLLPAYKMGHYLKLLGLPEGGVPQANAPVVLLDPGIPAPVDSSGYKLMPTEKEEVDKAGDAATWQRDIGILETIASVFHVLPTINADGKPLGVGMTVSWGFANLANAVSAVARGLQVHAADLTFQSSSATRNTGFLRASQDRVLNANSYAYETTNIDKQILTQQVRISMANHGILVQQQLIDNSQEISDFLKNKYTNQELYMWMQNGVQSIYHQLYNMAHDWAKKSEKAYRLERGIEDTNFIQFGYWESAYDGLLAGERLFMGLKQLESAYNETRGYDFEVSKFISLRQVSPMSLLQLRDTGSCQFSVPEILFDMDFPGHYLRKVKSVSVTLPCFVGPYTSVNCTLRLLSHQYRTTATASGAKDYPARTDQADTRFRTTNIPLSAIAVSSGKSDAGVFELNFHDERFMPFEGAGAISDWSLELPDGFRQFDYNSITDVVLQIRYTAMDGGATLGSMVSQYIATYIKTITDISQKDGLFALFDIKSEFSTEWYRAMTALPTSKPSTSPPTSRIFTLSGLTARLPVYTKGRLAKNILASDIMIVTDAALNPASLVLTQGGLNTVTFDNSHSASFKTMSLFAAHNLAVPIDDWVLTISNTTTAINSMWVLARYALH